MRYWSIPKYRRVGVPVCHAFLYYKPCGSFPRKLQGRHALIFISGHSRRLLTTANVPHGGRRQHGFPRPLSALLLKYLHGLNIQCLGLGTYGSPAVPRNSPIGHVTHVQGAGLVIHPTVSGITSLVSAVEPWLGGE